MEKPYVLSRRFGCPQAIYSSLSSLVEEHFTVVDLEKMASQPEVKQKIQAILVWGGADFIDSSLLQGLPNLKVPHSPHGWMANKTVHVFVIICFNDLQWHVFAPNPRCCIYVYP